MIEGGLVVVESDVEWSRSGGDAVALCVCARDPGALAFPLLHIVLDLRPGRRADCMATLWYCSIPYEMSDYAYTQGYSWL